MRLLGILFCLMPALACSQTSATFVPPSGWTLSPEPPALVLQPATMPVGQKLVIRLYNPSPANQDLAEWLRQQVTGGQCQPKLANADEASCLIQPGSGDHYYNALRIASGEYRLVVMEYSPDTTASFRHVPAIRKILQTAKAGDGRVAAQAASATAVGSLPVEGIYLHREHTFGIGGAMIFEFRPYLFFKDGTFTTDMAFHPSSTSQIPTWRARRPREWGRWKKSASSIDIQWDFPGSKPTHWKEWHVAEPGKPETSLAGPYRAIGGGGNTAIGGDSIVAGWSELNFLPNHTFTSDGGMMASTGGGSTGSNGGVFAKSTKAQRIVRYRIDGFTIHLDYGDGKQVTQWFYLYPGGDSAFGMGNKVYSSRKK